MSRVLVTGADSRTVELAGGEISTWNSIVRTVRERSVG